MDRPPRGPLDHARFGELVAVVIRQMDRAAGGGHIDQGRHRQQDGVDGITGIPDNGEAREHAVDARCQHHRHQGLALETPPTDDETDHERKTEEERHAGLTSPID